MISTALSINIAHTEGSIAVTDYIHINSNLCSLQVQVDMNFLLDVNRITKL